MTTVYLCTKDAEGKKVVSCHECWDATRFIAARMEEQAKAVPPGIVFVIDQDAYRAAKWPKKRGRK